jgi:hypothetical protein
MDGIGMKREYIIGWIETSVGKLPEISTKITPRDRWGTLKVRLTIGRMNYQVEPGVYAVGSPRKDSPVFVSANYKLSFDILRSQLDGIDAWILVLDTKGINVWCAAGKGTFGTSEIVKRIKENRLSEIVSHRKIIVPQLGAPGIAGYLVTRHTEFSVIYGPVRAYDIKKFLANDLNATKEMRRVRFTFYNRLVLTPAEFILGFKFLFLGGLIFFFLSGLYRGGFSIGLLVKTGFLSVLGLFLAYVAGTVLGPLFLPWLPGRSFSFKGIFPGLVLFIVAYLTSIIEREVLGIIGWILLFTAISSFILMNFTGSSTYTSLSGVRKEMRVAVPIQIVALTVGFSLWIVNRFV